MMTAEVAGHAFTDGRCRCGMFWVDIRNTEYADVGQPGIAHHGNANHAEVTAIHALKAKEDVAIAAASGWSAIPPNVPDDCCG